MKRVAFLTGILAGILVLHNGCKFSTAPAGSDTTKLTLTVDSFLASPEQWAGKDIVLSGTVSHVCRHSGKKLFLFGSNPDKTVKINAGGNYASFDIKYEGSDLEITGNVVEDTKIDANYLNEWEAEIKESISDKDQKVCNEENKALAGQTKDKSVQTEPVEDPYASVKEFRKKLEESGKSYISIYAISIKTLKEIQKASTVN